MPRWLNPTWPLIAALASLAMLAAAHAFETFGHLAPCDLCLKQRTVYWVAAALGLVGYGLGKDDEREQEQVQRERQDARA